MQKRLLLLGLLLAMGGCAGPQPYLGMVDEQEKDSSELSEIKAREMQARESEAAEKWFNLFVEAVDHAETWQEITQVLDQGNGYLKELVAWDDDYYTPLHYAAEKGDLEVVEELIERRGVYVDIRTGHKRTPLHLAALKGNLEIVEYLVKNGADVSLTDRQGSNALHYAASGIQGELNTAVVRYLIEQKKLDPGLYLGGRYNLLLLAIKANNTGLVEYIMEQCPRMALDRVHDMCPADYARAKKREGIAALIDRNTPK